MLDNTYRKDVTFPGGSRLQSDIQYPCTRQDWISNKKNVILMQMGYAIKVDKTSWTYSTCRFIC